MIYFLIGYMGSGKTTLGRKIARKLGWNFIDLDAVFEETTGLSISGYFERYGEDRFRQEERRILMNTPYPEHCVVATGGGLPCFFDNMAQLNRLGTTVYIQVPPAILAVRVQHGKQVRPLLQQLEGDALIAFITGKLAERETFYTQASLTVDGRSPDINELVKLLTDQRR